MTVPAVATTATATVGEVARLMLDQGVGAVPVLDASGAAIGMASDGDLLGRRSDKARRDWWLGILGNDFTASEVSSASRERTVREIMTSPLISISPHAPVQDIAEVLQAHRFKRVPVIDDGKLLGIVGRADLLCVVQSIPRTSAHEYARSGLLTFLESLIGGASLHGRLDHPVAAPAKVPPPQLVPSAEAFRTEVRAFKAETFDRKQIERLEAEIQRRREIKALLDHHVSEQLWRELLDHATLAARSGEEQLLLLRFPSDLCSDRGRKIDVAEKGWEQTLRGEAAELYNRWRRQLKPRGFGLSARVVSYEGGILGDIGLYLTWDE